MSKPLPPTMQVIEFSEHGGPSVLRLNERALPEFNAEEVLIEVAWAGINRPDCLQRAGLYDPPSDASDLLGLEVSGTIVATGSAVNLWRPGDTVCALTHGGGYAQYCAVDQSHCLPIPRGMDLRAAAALPENYFTVWSNVFQRGGLVAGETFLVHGGGSGIGTTAIQLAHTLGSTVLATAGSQRKCAVCVELGADLAINYREQDFVEEVKNFTGKRGADVILDMVGGDYLARNLRCLATDGRLVLIAFLRGAKAEINFAPLMVRRQTITGSTLRPQSVQKKGAIASALRESVWPLLESAQIAPTIDREFDFDQAVDAHEMMEANANIGKLLLNVQAGK